MTEASWTEKELREAALADQRAGAARVLWRLEQRTKRNKRPRPDPPHTEEGR